MGASANGQRFEKVISRTMVETRAAVLLWVPLLLIIAVSSTVAHAAAPGVVRSQLAREEGAVIPQHEEDTAVVTAAILRDELQLSGELVDLIVEEHGINPAAKVDTPGLRTANRVRPFGSTRSWISMWIPFLPIRTRAPRAPIRSCFGQRRGSAW